MKGKNKSLQKLSEQQIQWGLSLTIEERLKFIENFMIFSSEIQSGPVKSKLISIKIPEDLLKMFRDKCASQEVSYQTQIKGLMRKWIVE